MDNDNNRTSVVGRNVRALRMARGWSQIELGERAGLSSTTLTNVELGRKAPHRATIRALADALGVAISELTDPRPLKVVRQLVREASS